MCLVSLAPLLTHSSGVTLKNGLVLLYSAWHIRGDEDRRLLPTRKEYPDGFGSEHLSDERAGDRRNGAGFSARGQFEQGISEWPAVIDDDIGQLVEPLPRRMARLHLARMLKRGHSYQRMPMLFCLQCAIDNRHIDA